MGPSKASSRSAGVRPSADVQMRVLIDRFAPGHLRLIGALRRSLRKRLPTAHELVYEYRDCFVISYSPSDKGYEGVLAIRAGESVRLYFNRGKDLPDPEKLLHGSGSQARMIEVESAATLKRPAVVSLIEAAIARNAVPFARDGGGSVVFRSQAAGKRRRGRGDRD